MSGREIGVDAWHADEETIARYLGGTLPMAAAASVEAHVTGCAACRRALTARVPAGVSAKVDAAWDGVRERIEAPRQPWAVRLLRAAGLGEADAVVLGAARSMSTAWTAATALVLAFASFAAMTGSRQGYAFFLMVAPLVPVAGVVAAFGPRTDPLTEITGTAPYPFARLVLLRAGGVAVTSVPPTVLAGWALPGEGLALALGWLAPALAFTLVVLAASTWADPVYAGGAVGVSWVAVVAGTARRQLPPLTVVEGAAQFGYLALAAAAALVLAVRLHRSIGGSR